MSSKTVVQLPIASLIEDTAIYPRHTLDDQHVSSLVRALEVGETFPPLVADYKSKRLTDGWHRRRAYQKLMGANAVVDVELVKYASEQELILDAIARNSAHGRRLDKVDVVRSIELAEQAGAPIAAIAAVLHQSEEQVTKLKIRYAIAPEGSSSVVPGTEKIALKRPVIHMSGSTLTREQADAMPSVPGTSYLLIIHQLNDALKYGLLNWQDVKLREALVELSTALGNALDRHFPG